MKFESSWAEGQRKGGQEFFYHFLDIETGHRGLEPYWALGEEFDIPAAIHMGPGPPGAAYESSPVPMKHPEFRMALGDPMLLEEVLLRHKRLRHSVMHAGSPRLESMMALMYAHPNVYVDTGGLQSTRSFRGQVITVISGVWWRTASASASCSALTSAIRLRWAD